MYRDTLTLEELSRLKESAPDREIYNKIQDSWDAISKPIDGLGDFEKVICRIGAIQGKEVPRLDNKVAVIVCADNGVVSEGVTQTGQEVTLQVARMLGQGISTANTLAAKAGVKVVPVDVGIASEGEIPGVLDRKVAAGTRNFAAEPAMTPKEALMAIGTGIDLAKELKAQGADILIAGEMGIGNTTTASAMLALIIKGSAEAFVGRGAGLSDEGLKRKLAVVSRAVEDCRKDKDVNSSFDYLCRVGGLDIAALAGLFMGGCMFGIPVVIDGVITAVAALVAHQLMPGASEYMIAAHLGREKGLEAALDILGLEPFINGNMALGEGTGGIMAMPLLDMALDFYEKAAKFGDGGIEEYHRLS